MGGKGSSGAAPSTSYGGTTSNNYYDANGVPTWEGDAPAGANWTPEPGSIMSDSEYMSMGMASGMEGMIADMMKQREDYALSQSKLQEQYNQEAEKAAGVGTLDMLFSGRLDAANKAITDVNQQITDEAAHASTRGIDYAVTPEEKQARIDNLFADYWSEADDSKFNTYLGQYGTDAHQWTLNVKRGTGTGSAEGALPKEGAKVGGKVSAGTGKTVLTEDEEMKNTVLGG